MEDTFDPSKEGRRVVSQFGQPNENQVTEERQRYEEAQARSGKADGEKGR